MTHDNVKMHLRVEIELYWKLLRLAENLRYIDVSNIGLNMFRNFQP